MLKTKPMIPEYDLNPYLVEADILDFGRRLEAAAPDLFRMGELGRSAEGRPITLFTITDFSTGEPEDKPGYYLQAMVHSHELGGLIAALFFARELPARHRSGGILERVVFYIVPRINPDGAELIQQRGGCVRSRLDDADRTRPDTWFEEDIDGNRKILEIRYPDPFGKWMVSAEDPRVMLPRKAGSEGPFYALMPEGAFHQYDGSPVFRNGNTSFDWNRNYAANWSPLRRDGGAFPGSACEIRQMMEFFAAHPNIFGAVDFHNGPLAVLTAPATADGAIDSLDCALMKKMERLAAECRLEMAASNVYPEPPPKDIPGCFVDWTYFHCGIPGWTIELGTVVNSVADPEECLKLDGARTVHPRIYRWQSEHPGEPLRLYDWKKFRHPQLGDIEIGGVDCCAYSVPGRPEMREYCERVFQFCTRQAALAPHLAAEPAAATPLGANAWRVRLRLFNAGELSTSVTGRGAQLPVRRKPYLEFLPAPGVECLSMNRGVELEHLAAYGQRSLEWFVRGIPKDGVLGVVQCRGGVGGSFRVEIRAADGVES